MRHRAGADQGHRFDSLFAQRCYRERFAIGDGVRSLDDHRALRRLSGRGIEQVRRRVELAAGDAKIRIAQRCGGIAGADQAVPVLAAEVDPSIGHQLDDAVFIPRDERLGQLVALIHVSHGHRAVAVFWNEVLEMEAPCFNAGQAAAIAAKKHGRSIRQWRAVVLPTGLVEFRHKHFPGGSFPGDRILLGDHLAHPLEVDLFDVVRVARGGALAAKVGQLVGDDLAELVDLHDVGAAREGGVAVGRIAQKGQVLAFADLGRVDVLILQGTLHIQKPHVMEGAVGQRAVADSTGHIFQKLPVVDADLPVVTQRAGLHHQAVRIPRSGKEPRIFQRRHGVTRSVINLGHRLLDASSKELGVAAGLHRPRKVRGRGKIGVKGRILGLGINERFHCQGRGIRRPDHRRSAGGRFLRVFGFIAIPARVDQEAVAGEGDLSGIPAGITHVGAQSAGLGDRAIGTHQTDLLITRGRRVVRGAQGMRIAVGEIELEDIRGRQSGGGQSLDFGLIKGLEIRIVGIRTVKVAHAGDRTVCPSFEIRVIDLDAVEAVLAVHVMSAGEDGAAILQGSEAGAIHIII